jgi:hypothetical protein
MNPQPERQVIDAGTVGPDPGRAAPVKGDVIDVSSPAADGRTLLRGLVSLAGAAGIALLIPFVILLIGMPMALAAGGVVAAARWAIGLIVG